MRYPAGLMWVPVLLWGILQPALATNLPLTVSVACRSNPQCIFREDSIYLDIAIENHTDRDIFVTTKFMRSTGADIKIIDSRTKKASYSFASLGDYALLAEYEAIPPKGRIVMKSEVMTAFELTGFRKNFIDLQLQVNFSGKWKFAEGKSASFIETGYVNIIGEDTLAQRSLKN